MSTVQLVYVGHGTVVLVPALDAYVTKGVAVPAPADVAGQPPGPWRDRVEGDPQEWPIESIGGVERTYDPGSGLLAQPDVWQLAPKTAKPAIPDVTPEA